MTAIAGTDDEMGMASAPAEPSIGIEGKCKCTRHVRPHRRRVSMKMPSRGTAMTTGILIIAGLLVSTTVVYLYLCTCFLHRVE